MQDTVRNPHICHMQYRLIPGHITYDILLSRSQINTSLILLLAIITYYARGKFLVLRTLHNCPSEDTGYLMVVSKLAHCGRVTSYGDIHLGQRWLWHKLWLLAWRPEALPQQMLTHYQMYLWHSTESSFARTDHGHNMNYVFGDYTFNTTTYACVMN